MATSPTLFQVQSDVNLYLPQTPETPNPELFPEVAKIYAALRNLQIAITQYAGVGQKEVSSWPSVQPTDTIVLQNLTRLYVKATEMIPLGNTVNLYNDGAGNLVARRANATSGTAYQAHAFCTTLGGITAGQYGEVMLGGLCTFITGLSIGTTYYQSTTAGIIVNVKPSSPNMIQPVGYAIGASQLFWNPQMVQ